ncbi:aquaporin [Streptomyces heilongjiangensis]|uniref:Aquaporin n=1 Tax=Streptomyces heilongjiangensis TaxID=945052 RepID=A0ABW1AYN0_9ACTN|nr:aquaporin [Streptomyces heilongjiangensis]MDC2947919.1 aquaporin [Streptomyces heilongjiangensis]
MPSSTLGTPQHGVLLSRPARSRIVWAAEATATSLMLLAMTVLFRFLSHPGAWPARYVASPSVRLVTLAVVSGVVVAALIGSPLGRIGGAHMNPAVTVMLWLAGRTPGSKVPVHLSAQVAGSLLGTALGRVLLGPALADPQVRYAVLSPVDPRSAVVIGVGEAVATAVLLTIVLRLVRHPELEEVASATLGSTLAVLMILTARTTGGSLNPARQFGPWVMADSAGPVWPYLTGPLAAAVLVGAVARLLPRR